MRQSSGAAVPPFFRPRTLDNPLRPCSSSSQIQIRAKRRSESLRPCPTAQSHSTTIPLVGVSPKWREWANLGGGPAELVAERLLANDVADYVRFRAVCRPWRRCCVDPRAHVVGLDRRFHPRQWIMLLQDELAAPDDQCRFLNATTGECIKTDLRELLDHDLLAVTSEGFLLLLHESTYVLRLLNPVTRQLTDLPPVTTLLPPEQLGDGLLAAWGSGIASDLTVVLHLRGNGHNLVAVSKPGDEHWTLVTSVKNEYLTADLMFAGHFYCITNKGVMVLEAARADEPPQLEVVVEGPLYGMTSTPHLVDNDGELLLVQRRLEHGSWKRLCHVYRVDLGTGTLISVNSLGGRAVFMGMKCSLSVSTKVFPFIRGDTIYLSFEFDDRCMQQTQRIKSYHITDGSTEPSNPDGPMAHPLSVVDCLSWCVTVT